MRTERNQHMPNCAQAAATAHRNSLVKCQICLVFRLFIGVYHLSAGVSVYSLIARSCPLCAPIIDGPTEHVCVLTSRPLSTTPFHTNAVTRVFDIRSGRHMHFLVNNYTAEYTMRKRPHWTHTPDTNNICSKSETDPIRFRTRWNNYACDPV